MTYWHAWDLMAIARSGEYYFNGKMWVTVFGHPDRYEPISSRLMQSFHRRGFILDGHLPTTGEPIVKLSRKGHEAYHKYFARYHKDALKRYATPDAD